MAPDGVLNVLGAILSNLHTWLTSTFRTVAGGRAPSLPRPPFRRQHMGCQMFLCVEAQRINAHPLPLPSSSLLDFPGLVLELEAKYLDGTCLPSCVVDPGSKRPSQRQPEPQKQPGWKEQWRGAKGRWEVFWRIMRQSVCVCGGTLECAGGGAA